MRKTILCLLAGMAPLCLAAQTGYTIKGQIGKLNKPAKAFLLVRYTDRVDLDSTQIVNGKFEFKGKMDSPMEAHLRVRHDATPDHPSKMSTYDVKPLLLSNEAISVTAKDSISKAVITGSALNAENDKVTAYLKPIYGKYEALNNEYREQPEAKKQDQAYIQSLEVRAKAIEKEILDAKLSYIEKNPNQHMALMAFSSLLGPEFDVLAMEKIFLSLNENIRTSYLGKQVGAKIATAKKTLEGVEAADFAQPDVDGKMVKLSDYRGKYVLIDFWASWCAPCRRENPNLVKAYDQYKSKGFEILGVSMDKASDKAKWLKAIEDDKLTWKQVADLKGWDNEAGMLYEVKAIPMNFLINPEGKIIAKYLRGEELSKKLEEIFKGKP
ncbi:Peroxiredoxin [Pedobacter sp. ok626]|uniref:TlpA disulfide reductase family protein n=1 Tax=Pedobacter sp. ok626 TaxID=1761882 RepID=UPI00088D3A5E|nr:TlpA disulfide reductase family protein [Pedobacter sp. ok626]SDK66497.1 Peroxiredoxin [Pedobacter sp. ok626]